MISSSSHCFFKCYPYVPNGQMGNYPNAYKPMPYGYPNAASRFLLSAHMGSNRDSQDVNVNKFKNPEGVMTWDENEAYM